MKGQFSSTAPHCRMPRSAPVENLLPMCPEWTNVAFGEPGGARTRDHRIKSAMLYQLSYRPNAFKLGDLQEWLTVRLTPQCTAPLNP